VRHRLALDQDSPVLGFVGRLTRDKGLPELIEAFDTILAAEPKAHLLLVGWFDEAEDALDAKLRALILRHPNIRYTGFVEDTAPYYRAMDLMILPTWREGFPNAVLEAAATGIPVITTQCTGSRDSVVPEVTGLLIPPGYPAAIAEAVLKLLRNPERRRSMGKAARAWVCEHFGNEHVLGLAATYYKSLLHEAAQKEIRRTAHGFGGSVILTTGMAGEGAGISSVLAPASAARRTSPGTMPRSRVAATASNSAAPTATPTCGVESTA
jgi:glycosyltransferase involved in cell wall biosynthesis